MIYRFTVFVAIMYLSSACTTDITDKIYGSSPAQQPAATATPTSTPTMTPTPTVTPTPTPQVGYAVYDYDDTNIGTLQDWDMLYWTVLNGASEIIDVDKETGYGYTEDTIYYYNTNCGGTSYALISDTSYRFNYYHYYDAATYSGKIVSNTTIPSYVSYAVEGVCYNTSGPLDSTAYRVAFNQVPVSFLGPLYQ